MLGDPENVFRNHVVNSCTARVGNNHNIDLLALSDRFSLRVCEFCVLFNTNSRSFNMLIGRSE